jgi:hypothetical protein
LNLTNREYETLIVEFKRNWAMLLARITQYDRLGPNAARPAQGARRIGQREPSDVPRLHDVQPDGDVHNPGEPI